MLNFLARRLTGALLVLLLVSLLAFGIIWLVPGDPTAILLDASATPEQAARLRAQLGLDRPFLLQMAVIYVPWLQPVFHTEALGPGDLVLCLVAAAVIFVAVEFEKAWRRRQPGFAQQAMLLRTDAGSTRSPAEG